MQAMQMKAEAAAVDPAEQRASKKAKGEPKSELVIRLEESSGSAGAMNTSAGWHPSPCSTPRSPFPLPRFSAVPAGTSSVPLFTHAAAASAANHSPVAVATLSPAAETAPIIAAAAAKTRASGSKKKGKKRRS